MQFLHSWTTLKLAIAEAELEIKAREVGLKEKQAGDRQSNMIIGLCLLGLMILIIATLIKLLIEYGKTGE
jgi:hypothetical protein